MVKFNLLLPIHPSLHFKGLKYLNFIAPRLKAFELHYILPMFKHLLLYPLIDTLNHLGLVPHTAPSVVPVPLRHLLHLDMSLRHPLSEVPSVLYLSELHSKKCCVVVFESLPSDFPCPVSDGTKGVLPEGLLDGKVECLDTAFASLHVLVPLGQDVTKLQTVVVVVHSVHYGLERP